MNDWFDEPDDLEDDDIVYYEYDDDDGLDDLVDDDWEPEPPIKNIDNPCMGCEGRGYYIGDDIDAGWQMCRDCMGTGDNKVAEQRDWW